MADRYVQGDTVWLKGSFYDRAGSLYDPTEVTLKIYDSGRQLLSTITGDDVVHISVGVYEAPYVLPAYNSIVYEFSGKDSDGNVQLYRDTVEIQWAD